jgi:hypothetical protein
LQGKHRLQSNRSVQIHRWPAGIEEEGLLRGGGRLQRRALFQQPLLRAGARLGRHSRRGERQDVRGDCGAKEARPCAQCVSGRPGPGRQVQELSHCARVEWPSGSSYLLAAIWQVFLTTE